jgi:CheY-like chemotaxis protein
VEDNDINIKIATQFLEKWDIEVEVAKDGQIAVEIFKPDKFHLVLMDLHLPNMDGYQATEAIRKQDKNIPIIALTAAVKIQEKEKVLSSGMNDFISKPFKPRELYNKITSNLLNATLRAG